MRRTTSFDAFSVKVDLMDSPVSEFINQKSSKFRTGGVHIFHLYEEQNSLGGLSPKFFVVGVHDIIKPFKFGDDRFRGFWLAEGQSLPSPIDFEGRPYNTHTIV